MDDIIVLEQPPKEHLWMCFGIHETKANIIFRFEKRFGFNPEKIYLYKNQLWAGPVHTAPQDSIIVQEDV